MRHWIASMAVLCIALPAAADPPMAAIVDLTTRVPARWLTDEADNYPLEPARQRARMPRECRTRGGYRRFCQGARLVPQPFGDAAVFARRLALGQRATAMQMMFQPPFQEWM